MENAALRLSRLSTQQRRGRIQYCCARNIRLIIVRGERIPMEWMIAFAILPAPAPAAHIIWSLAPLITDPCALCSRNIPGGSADALSCSTRAIFIIISVTASGRITSRIIWEKRRSCHRPHERLACPRAILSQFARAISRRTGAR